MLRNEDVARDEAPAAQCHEEGTVDTKKLYRSRTDKMIAGVCGGLGKHLEVDPTILRLLFALLVVLGFGSGILIYIVLMLIVPLEPEA